MEMNLPGYATVSVMDGVPDDSILVTIGGGSPFDSTGNAFVDGLTASVSGIILEDILSTARYQLPYRSFSCIRNPYNGRHNNDDRPFASFSVC